MPTLLGAEREVAAALGAFFESSIPGIVLLERFPAGLDRGSPDWANGSLDALRGEALGEQGRACCRNRRREGSRLVSAIIYTREKPLPEESGR